ncbi:MAG TPA: sensor histidine kinase [Streptosporangiaceae bacterium]|nr:sensor histidine kinase [Streptosporangiaceae bacterium]
MAGKAGVTQQSWVRTELDARAQRGPMKLPPGMASTMLPGNGSPLRWFFSSIWLVYLIQPISELFGRQHGVLYTAGGLAIAAAFCAVYVPIVGNSIRWPQLALCGLVVIALLTIIACTVYGKDWTPMWIYVSAATGMVLAGQISRRKTLLAVAAVGAAYTFFSWLGHDHPGDYLVVLLPVLLIGVAMIGFRMQVELMHELSQARETVAKMAANEERLRLARDMHDLTGQSLSVITLKAELAAKRLTRLPASAERDAILTELGDVSQVSRQTLHDIREAVSGYRRPTLAIEVITARSALDAAGIQLDDDPELTIRSGTFDPEAEAVLAWCLREAVTNVIRHSRARHCRLRLTERPGEVSLQVTDDGRGFSGPAMDSAKAAATGSGLRGISERLSAADGHLSLGRGDSGRGFRLTATVRTTTAGTGHNCEP